MEEGRAWDVVQSGLGIAGYACGHALVLKPARAGESILRVCYSRDLGIGGIC